MVFIGIEVVVQEWSSETVEWEACQWMDGFQILLQVLELSFGIDIVVQEWSSETVEWEGGHAMDRFQIELLHKNL